MQTHITTLMDGVDLSPQGLARVCQAALMSVSVCCVYLAFLMFMSVSYSAGLYWRCELKFAIRQWASNRLRNITTVLTSSALSIISVHHAWFSYWYPPVIRYIWKSRLEKRDIWKVYVLEASATPCPFRGYSDIDKAVLKLGLTSPCKPIPWYVCHEIVQRPHK